MILVGPTGGQVSQFYTESMALPTGTDGGLEVVPATVTIEGTTIASVERGRGAGAVDLGRRLVTPALVNAHTHLAMSAYRGIGGLASMEGNVVEDLYYALESGLQPGDVRAFTRVAAAESLLTGTGTVWEHYYAGMEGAEAFAEAGITAVVAPTLQDLEGPGTRQLEAQLDATLAIAGDARLRDAGVVAALGPHATDTVSAELWGRVAELSGTHQLPIHAHAAQSIEEYRRAVDRHGCGPVAWLTREGWLEQTPMALLVHLLYADRAEMDGLDPGRTALGYCPASQMQYCFPAPVDTWRRSVVLGTDCGACNDTMNLAGELRLLAAGSMFGVATSHAQRSFYDGTGSADDLAAVREHLWHRSQRPVEQLLGSVFEGPGRLHPGLLVGAIRPGWRANLVAWDLEHPSFWPGRDPLRSLVFQDVAPAISRMMVNGRWLSEDGDHQGALLRDPALAEARREADCRMERLCSSFLG